MATIYKPDQSKKNKLYTHYVSGNTKYSANKSRFVKKNLLDCPELIGKKFKVFLPGTAYLDKKYEVEIIGLDPYMAECRYNCGKEDQTHTFRTGISIGELLVEGVIQFGRDGIELGRKVKK